jgi:hypothetical protein
MKDKELKLEETESSQTLGRSREGRVQVREVKRVWMLLYCQVHYRE